MTEKPRTWMLKGFEHRTGGYQERGIEAFGPELGITSVPVIELEPVLDGIEAMLKLRYAILDQISEERARPQDKWAFALLREHRKLQ